MRNIFTLYLATKERSTLLTLPASPYEMLDALERLEIKNTKDIVYREIEECHDFGFLEQYFDEDIRLEDLNALTHRLAYMDRCDRIAFEGLIKMDTEKQRTIDIPRMIDLAHCADACHIVSDAFDDEQLGRFYAGNGFIPELDDLPDSIYEKLDFARIGREMREAEHGVFTPRGYVMLEGDVEEIYATLDTAIRKPDYVFRLVLISKADGQCVNLDLPATRKQIDLTLMEISLDSVEGARLHDYDSPFQSLDISLDGTDDLDDLNRLAMRIRSLEQSGDVPKLKALLSSHDSVSVTDALRIADELDSYHLEPDVRSPDDLGKSHLFALMPPNDAELLMDHVNLCVYGEAILKKYGGRLTPYGLLSQAQEQTMERSSEMTMQMG